MRPAAMIPATALAAALAFAPVNAGAAPEVDDQLGKCARMGDNGARLRCYDRLAKRLGLAPPEGRDSAWIVQEEKAAGGGTNVYLHVNATADISQGWETARPELWLTCAEGATQIYVNMGVFLHSEKVHMVIRLDRQRPIAEYYPVSKDGKTAFLAVGDGAAFVAKSLAERRNMSVRAQPYQQKPVNVDFPIAGLDAELPALAGACGW